MTASPLANRERSAARRLTPKRRWIHPHLGGYCCEGLALRRSGRESRGGPGLSPWETRNLPPGPRGRRLLQRGRSAAPGAGRPNGRRPLPHRRLGPHPTLPRGPRRLRNPHALRPVTPGTCLCARCRGTQAALSGGSGLLTRRGELLGDTARSRARVGKARTPDSTGDGELPPSTGQGL